MRGKGAACSASSFHRFPTPMIAAPSCFPLPSYNLLSFFFVLWTLNTKDRKYCRALRFQFPPYNLLSFFFVPCTPNTKDRKYRSAFLICAAMAIAPFSPRGRPFLQLVTQNSSECGLKVFFFLGGTEIKVGRERTTEGDQMGILLRTRRRIKD